MGKPFALHSVVKEELAKMFIKFLIPLFMIIMLINIITLVIPVFLPKRFSVAIVVWFGILSAIILSRKKSYYTGALTMNLIMVFAICVGIFFNGGLNAPAYIAFYVPLVFIGMLVNYRFMLGFVAFYLIYGVFITLLQHNNLLPYRSPLQPISLYFQYSTYFIAISVAVIKGNLMLHKAIFEAEEKKKMIDAAFTSISDAIFMLDKDYTIVHNNSIADSMLSFILNHQKVSSFNDIIFHFQNEEKSEESSLQAYIIRHSILNNVQCWFKKNHSTWWYTVSASPLILDNEVGGCVVTMRDITVQIEQEAQILQSQKMDAVGQLASGIAHDFNNLLGGIQGAAELVQGHARDDQKKMLQLIQDAVTRASKLTGDLLVFSRKAPQVSTAVDVNDIVRETCAILDRTIDKRIVIYQEIGAKNCSVVGDDTQIQSAFMNMGINASHAMQNGGSLTFKTDEIALDDSFCTHTKFDITPGNYLLVEIIDSGTGMSNDVIEHIFEPFYTTKDVGKGTGLGLAAVYGMVVKHKGAITVYSEVGVGTAFHIYLPLLESQISKSELSSYVITKGTGTILVVDDEECIRITTKQMLKEMGYSVLLAENGDEALDILKSSRIDIVIMDMIMPVKNGKDTFEEIMINNNHTKVILSSGFSKDEDVQSMKEHGLFGFLHKPFIRTELSQMVHNAFQELE